MMSKEVRDELQALIARARLACGSDADAMMGLAALHIQPNPELP